MTSLKSREPNRAWVWCALGCLAMTMSVSRCSRQSVPSSPSAVGSHIEAEHDHGGAVSDASPAVASELAAVRAATAKYHDVSAAIAAGYQLGYNNLVTGCISSPAGPSVGAMGYHYFNVDKMDDPEDGPKIVELDPEVLVYHKADDGTLVLGAVEWVVPKKRWEDAGNVNPPVVFGHALHVINPVLNWYIEHAWVWTHNSAGIFADWNPDVTCP